MLRRLRTALLVAALAAIGGAAALGARAPDPRDGIIDHGGSGYFVVVCSFSHRNNDDPIVYPRRPGLSHEHTFFGNETTNASSTAASLADGPTTCASRADSSAYWVPTLFVDRRAVEPTAMTVYYVRATRDRARPFPAGLKIIAGDSHARTPQSREITFWSCAAEERTVASARVPTCAAGDYGSLRLNVNFPSCWDGKSVDSVDHKRHMAYAVDGTCPAGYPVDLPQMILIVHYPPVRARGAILSSGGQFSGHADFINGWDQDVLARFVNRDLNG